MGHSERNFRCRSRILSLGLVLSALIAKSYLVFSSLQVSPIFSESLHLTSQLHLSTFRRVDFAYLYRSSFFVELIASLKTRWSCDCWSAALSSFQPFMFVPGSKMVYHVVKLLRITSPGSVYTKINKCANTSFTLRHASIHFSISSELHIIPSTRASTVKRKHNPPVYCYVRI